MIGPDDNYLLDDLYSEITSNNPNKTVNQAIETQTDNQIQESHSIACGGNDEMISERETHSMSIDARDMVKELIQ